MTKDKTSSRLPMNEETSGKRTTKKKKKDIKLRKHPNAPKRFKSPFMFFSMAYHPKLRPSIKGENNGAPNVAKLVSKAWRKIKPEERGIYEKMAEEDKKRYEMEKMVYTGPWKTSASRHDKKDPTAPKRPMSAFLAYAKDMRSEVKRNNPQKDNKDISRMLSENWRKAPRENRDIYIKEELKAREKYKLDMAKWRDDQEKKLQVQSRERQHQAEILIANSVSDCNYDHSHHYYSSLTKYSHTPRNTVVTQEMFMQSHHRDHSFHQVENTVSGAAVGMSNNVNTWHKSENRTNIPPDTRKNHPRNKEHTIQMNSHWQSWYNYNGRNGNYSYNKTDKGSYWKNSQNHYEINNSCHVHSMSTSLDPMHQTHQYKHNRNSHLQVQGYLNQYEQKQQYSPNINWSNNYDRHSLQFHEPSTSENVNMAPTDLHCSNNNKLRTEEGSFYSQWYDGNNGTSSQWTLACHGKY